MGGYQENNHNVIARTPAKNSQNLKELQKSILDGIQDADIQKCEDIIEIPREYHRIINLFYHETLKELEAKHNATIIFPKKEDGSEIITIHAPNSTAIDTVKAEITKMEPELQEFDIPFTKSAHELVETTKFQLKIIQMEQDLYTSIEIYSAVDEDIRFTVIYRRNDKDTYETVKEAVLKCFIDARIPTEQHEVPTKALSYVNIETSRDAINPFDHFNSKLMAPFKGINLVGH
jgi:hypothetical protein